MVSQSAIIPIATLSGIVAVMLLFVVWWFPRTWNKGNAQERAIIDEQQQYLANLRLQQQQQQQAVNRPGDPEAGAAGGVPPGEGDDAKPPAYVVRPEYRPPVAGLG